MLGYGHDESVPYAWRSVRNQFRWCSLRISRTVRWHFEECSPRYRKPSAAFWQTVRSRRGPIYRARIYVFATTLRPFEMLSRNVRNVLIICRLHIQHLKVWVLHGKRRPFAA